MFHFFYMDNGQLVTYLVKLKPSIKSKQTKTFVKSPPASFEVFAGCWSICSEERIAKLNAQEEESKKEFQSKECPGQNISEKNSRTDLKRNRTD